MYGITLRRVYNNLYRNDNITHIHIHEYKKCLLSHHKERKSAGNSTKSFD